MSYKKSVCSLPFCNSRVTNNKKLADLDKVKFFAFPKNQTLAEKWKEFCEVAVPDKQWDIMDKTIRICSGHFTVDDFERDLQREMMGGPLRKILKEGAVPSLRHTPLKRKISVSPVKIEQKRPRQEEPSEITSPSDIASSPEPGTSDEYVESFTDVETLRAELNTLRMSNKLLQYRVANLSKEAATMRTQYQVLKATHNRYKNRSRASTSDHVNEQVYTTLNTILTPNQVDIVLKKSSKVHWTPDEIGIAINIRFFSTKCYNFLKTKLKYPLPAISTLHCRCAKLNIGRGHLTDSLRMMAIASTTYAYQGRLTVLQFGEMAVSQCYEYDKWNDQIIGPHYKVQVVMARGLIHSWKQPVYVAFDQNMTKEILEKVIENVHQAGFTVVAIDSECGPDNFSLWNKVDGYGISPDHPYMVNPIDRNLKIFWFPDGNLMSETAVAAMQEYLTEMFDIEYVPTQNANQDALENFFAQIRNRKELNEHPTPMNCFYRIRLLIVGRNYCSVKAEPKTQPKDKKDMFLVAEVLKQAKLGPSSQPIPEGVLNFSDTVSDISSPAGGNPPIIEDGSIEHLSGWVAEKLFTKYPHLGFKISDIADDEAESSSDHGFIKPSQDWMKQAKQIHKCFNNFLPDKGFVEGPDIVQRLRTIVMKKSPHHCKEAVELYIRLRLFARITKLNAEFFQKEADETSGANFTCTIKFEADGHVDIDEFKLEY